MWRSERGLSTAGRFRKSASFGTTLIKLKKLNRPQENFGLSLESFTELCQQLQMGDTTLFENIFLTHFSECMQYLRNKYNEMEGLFIDEEVHNIKKDFVINFCKALIVNISTPYFFESSFSCPGV